MKESAGAVRVFGSTISEERSIRFGDHRIFLTPGVEAVEGGPLSAYTAAFGVGERADLPAAYEEVWVVVRGRLRIRTADTEVTAGAGDYLHVPEDTPGEVDVLDDTTLVCVSVPGHPLS